jgi:hypothetical protein
MVYFIPNILSKEECEFLSKQFDIEKIINFSSDKKENTNESYGFRPSYNFDKYMETLKSKVLGFNNEITHIDSVNTYVREYHNSAFLTKHVDRKDISVTMSICLESTINKEWPLFTEIDGKKYSFNTNVGDGILLFNADVHTHWRDTLICNENERVLQFFLHWKPVDYLTKKTKSLI